MPLARLFRRSSSGSMLPCTYRGQFRKSVEGGLELGLDSVAAYARNLAYNVKSMSNVSRGVHIFFTRGGLQIVSQKYGVLVYKRSDEIVMLTNSPQKRTCVIVTRVSDVPGQCTFVNFVVRFPSRKHLEDFEELANTHTRALRSGADYAHIQENSGVLTPTWDPPPYTEHDTTPHSSANSQLCPPPYNNAETTSLAGRYRPSTNPSQQEVVHLRSVTPVSPCARHSLEYSKLQSVVTPAPTEARHYPVTLEARNLQRLNAQCEANPESVSLTQSFYFDELDDSDATYLTQVTSANCCWFFEDS
eukprot:m.25683 g.25683  ORF g.25683 m.25683 type:complete len:303 (+) comp6227_c0_seq1:188-1096(+)